MWGSGGNIIHESMEEHCYHRISNALWIMVRFSDKQVPGNQRKYGNGGIID